MARDFKDERIRRLKSAMSELLDVVEAGEKDGGSIVDFWDPLDIRWEKALNAARLQLGRAPVRSEMSNGVEAAPPEKDKRLCRHGEHVCEACGQPPVVVSHETVGGDGKVAKLFGRPKKRRRQR